MNASRITTLPYRIARMPLDLVDRLMAKRVAPDAPSRLKFDRAVASIDTFAARVLRDDGLRIGAQDRVQRVTDLEDAEELERSAATRRTQARNDARASEESARRKRNRASDRLAEGVRDAATTEAKGKEEAARQARESSDREKRASKAKAERELATVRESADVAVEAVTAEERAAEAAAKTALDDAAQDDSRAAQADNEADVLDALTEQKKQQRKNT